MVFVVDCEGAGCDQKFRVSESAVGKRARCKKCGTSTLIKPAAGSVASVGKPFATGAGSRPIPPSRLPTGSSPLRSAPAPRRAESEPEALSMDDLDPEEDDPYADLAGLSEGELIDAPPMPAQRYVAPSPGSRGGTLGYAPLPEERLRELAKHQRRLQYAILLNIIPFTMLIGIPLAVMSAWGMATGLGRDRWLYTLGCFVPYVNLLVLFSLSRGVTRELTAAGIKVGLMGAKI